MEAYTSTMAPTIKDRFAKGLNTAGEEITSPHKRSKSTTPTDSKTD
jgi:hypothetical protein